MRFYNISIQTNYKEIDKLLGLLVNHHQSEELMKRGEVMTLNDENMRKLHWN